MNGLGGTYSAQGRHKEAEELLREALDIRKRVLGPEHTDTLYSMHSLASAYALEGRFKDADELLRETFDIVEKRGLGPGDMIRLDSTYALASVAALRGERSEALGYLRDAVEHGFSDPKWMIEDPDLSSLHGDPEFEKIVAAARANQERARRTK